MESLEQRERIAAEEHLKDIQGEMLLLIHNINNELILDSKEKKDALVQKSQSLLEQFYQAASSPLINDELRIKSADFLHEEILRRLRDYCNLGVIDEGLYFGFYNFLGKFLNGLVFRDNDVFVRYTDMPGQPNEEGKTYWTLLDNENSGKQYGYESAVKVFASYRDLLNQGVVYLDTYGKGAGAKIEVLHRDKGDHSNIIRFEKDKN